MVHVVALEIGVGLKNTFKGVVLVLVLHWTNSGFSIKTSKYSANTLIT